MKKFAVAALAAISLVSATFAVAAPEEAKAQTGTITCEASSGYAVGLWTAYNGDYACRRALRECAIRTPSYGTCYVTRWWYS